MHAKNAGFQRAAAAPALPPHTVGFILYCLRQFRGMILLMMVMEAGQAAGGILVPYAIKGLMDSVAAQPAGANLWDTFEQPLLLLVGLNVAEILFSRASGALLVITGPRLRQRSSQLLYAYLQQHSPRYFADHFAGGLAHRISETAMSVNHTTWSVLFDFWPITITFTVSIALLFQAHSGLGGFVAVWVLFYVLSSYWLATRCQPYAQNYAAVRSQVNGKIVDTVTNMLNVKLFARLAYEREYLEGVLEEELREGRRTFWYMERVRWFQFIAAATLKIGTIVYALRLWNDGEIGVGDFAMSTGLALLIIGDARNLTRRFLEFFEYVGNVANGVEIIVKPHEIIDRPDAQPLQVSAGRIEFRKVCFGYRADRPVFENLSVTIEPGQRVGLVGFSGSGKSTFVSLILRNYEPLSGQILIDGQDILQTTQDSLHRQVSLIPQEPSLFHRSLRENIAYGRLRASDEDILEATRLAHADAFIADMPDGYDAMVGERGVKLSGGQRQRIAIARVLLKDAPILILDEATSSLDSLTEKTIQENLDRVMGVKTVIAVAHRLSTIAHLDRILVFDKGRIVEDGNHDALLAQKGFYFRLWSMQAGGFLPDRQI
ncbi:ABC transporter ATP-binding protein/permease [Methylomonas sp. SURF-2]|uniref:ABC transporter ATP-binding protein/permease n=1 Tax=Methylomonas subterranea TaxID=2952225 RepID=A0ABT1TLL9_9GAMM|nr:ABC transporter ATP-binding protein [Methylomonas sp. SURF-2]MCQ8106364.1 ABC transporter ATP-binding protein/permease [Methylomonas sp. SURF-2]